MDNERLTYLLSVINQLTASQETLSEHLSRMEAMAQVAVLAENFLDFEPWIIHDYLWQLSELLTEANQKSKEILSGLLKLKCPWVGEAHS